MPLDFIKFNGIAVKSSKTTQKELLREVMIKILSNSVNALIWTKKAISGC